MATRTWNGSNDNFLVASKWSPAGVPMSGDTAIINSGIVGASGLAFSNITIDLNANAAAGGILVLDSDTLDGLTVLVVDNSNIYGAPPITNLTIEGVVTSAATIDFLGTITDLQVGSFSSFINTGTINLVGASLRVLPGTGATAATVDNFGVIQVTNPGNVLQATQVDATINGAGIISVGTYASLDLIQAVSGGQNVSFTGAGGSTLQVGSPNAFAATITGFGSGDQLLLNDVPYSGYTYTATSSSSGTLTLYNGSVVESQIKFAGTYSASSFTVAASFAGIHEGDNVTVTTAVTNSSQPVYRFFDTVSGTHLFTQSLTEAQQIIATRPDLTHEANGFGAVSSSNTSAEPVYRFFETTNGSHLFTASAVEFQALTTPGTSTYRADLIYEPSSVFCEDGTQQAGDVAVFRLFDSVHGTQFLTGSQPEYASLTAPGSSTYRPDLTPEGVAFYAPAGVF